MKLRNFFYEEEVDERSKKLASNKAHSCQNWNNGICPNSVFTKHKIVTQKERGRKLFTGTTASYSLRNQQRQLDNWSNQSRSSLHSSHVHVNLNGDIIWTQQQQW